MKDEPRFPHLPASSGSGKTAGQYIHDLIKVLKKHIPDLGKIEGKEPERPKFRNPTKIYPQITFPQSADEVWHLIPGTAIDLDVEVHTNRPNAPHEIRVFTLDEAGGEPSSFQADLTFQQMIDPTTGLTHA